MLELEIANQLPSGFLQGFWKFVGKQRAPFAAGWRRCPFPLAARVELLLEPRLQLVDSRANVLRAVFAPERERVFDREKGREIPAAGHHEFLSEAAAVAEAAHELRRLEGRPSDKRRWQSVVVSAIDPAESRAFRSHQPLMQIAAIKVDITQRRKVERERSWSVRPIDDEQDAAIASLFRDPLYRQDGPIQGHDVAHENHRGVGTQFRNDVFGRAGSYAQAVSFGAITTDIHDGSVLQVGHENLGAWRNRCAQDDRVERFGDVGTKKNVTSLGAQERSKLFLRAPEARKSGQHSRRRVAFVLALMSRDGIEHASRAERMGARVQIENIGINIELSANVGERKHGNQVTPGKRQRKDCKNRESVEIMVTT